MRHLKPDECREAAYKVLWRMLKLVSSPKPAQRKKAMQWIASRSDEDGGFLWVAACLNRQPSVLAEAFVELDTTAVPQRRQGVGQRLRRVGR